jgi:hypothetical protein
VVKKRIARLRQEGAFVKTKSSATQSDVPLQIDRRRRVETPSLRENKRRLWLSIRKHNPNASRNKLRMHDIGAYNWLYNNDKEWLEANSPSRMLPMGPDSYVNWEERDKELERAIKDEANRMLHVSGRPVRISATGVARQIGKLTLISKNADKLPLTTKALNEVTESLEAYAIRRAQWSDKASAQTFLLAASN